MPEKFTIAKADATYTDYSKQVEKVKLQAKLDEALNTVIRKRALGKIAYKDLYKLQGIDKERPYHEAYNTSDTLYIKPDDSRGSLAYSKQHTDTIAVSPGRVKNYSQGNLADIIRHEVTHKEVNPLLNKASANLGYYTREFLPQDSMNVFGQNEVPVRTFKYYGSAQEMHAHTAGVLNTLYRQNQLPTDYQDFKKKVAMLKRGDGEYTQVDGYRKIIEMTSGAKGGSLLDKMLESYYNYSRAKYKD